VSRQRHGVVARWGSGITGATTFASASAAPGYAATEGHEERQHPERGLPATPSRWNANEQDASQPCATGAVPPASGAHGMSRAALVAAVVEMVAARPGGLVEESG
jgi:hypothetical protein